MTVYKYIRELWKKPKQSMPELWRERLLKWRREPVTLRIERPTRLDRARSLGYKAKPGYIIIRQRVQRGGHRRPDIKGGRRPRHNRQRLVLNKRYQSIAEERAVKKYPNCEVLNSYWVAQDGKYYWFEIILIDINHPVIKKSKDIAWISSKKARAQRGITSSGRKSRGLLCKGKGAEKLRPSKAASYRRKVSKQS
ncbi:50S ribosomal protein L15e [Candidatus Woesearchaeota archaeon]|nr:50S ribosomal protein L15e [Candidatus Woesearchaeota archaeon]